MKRASGQGSEIFHPHSWNVPDLVGKAVYLRLVDQNTGGWGHIVMDAFSAQGTLMPEATKKRQAQAKPKPAQKKVPPLRGSFSARDTALSPAEQLAGFTVPEGFVIELVASEENGVINPIDISFDDAGRLWTQTGRMYPLDPISGMKWSEFLALMDDVETQNNHPEFKRIKDLYELKSKGTDEILILDDPTKPAKGPLHVWADGLSIPQSVLPYKDGAYVCHGSELFLLRDTDGDGKSDKMEPVLSGFGFSDTHTMSHLLVRGPGSFVHFSQGALNKGKVTAVASGKQARVDASCQVRFSLDGRDFEVLSAGPSNMWGLQLRADGQWYGTEANDRAYSVMPWEHGVAATGAAFHPMRAYQPLMPELHRFRVGGTGISGLEFSEDGAGGFPEEWQDVALLANCITSKINAVRIHRNPSGTVEAEHLPDFLSSKDSWFRPVNLEFGPDGCLYVADFYNKIISHNEVTTDHPARDRSRDRSHGRIWRIRHESQPKRSVPNVAKASPTELIAHLKASNLWEKRAAWQQIGDRGLSELAPTLIGLAADEKIDLITRIHALWTLEELKHFDAPLLDALLKSKSGSLRREAVRSLASFDLAPAEVASRLGAVIEDANCMVRSQAIRALSDLKKSDPAVIALIITACKPALEGNTLGGSYERNHERFLARMALEKFPAELQEYLAKSSGQHPDANLLWALQALEGDAKQKAFLGLWDKVASQDIDPETFVAIAGMLGNQDVYTAVAPTLQDPSRAEKLVRLALANQSRVQSPELAKMLTPAASQLLKSDKTLPLALGAVARLRIDSLAKEVAAIDSTDASPETLSLLLSAQAASPKLNAARFKELAARDDLPVSLRVDAIHALAASDGKSATTLAISFLEKSDRARLISVLSQSPTGGAVLRALVKQKTISAGDFDISSAERLLQGGRWNGENRRIYKVASQRLAEEKKQARSRIHHLTRHIQANPGDPAKGKFTFATCLTCHKVGSEGQDIAPPLDGSGHRDLEHLLTAIVDPDAAVEGGYGLYRVTKTDGSAVEGLLEKEEPLGTTVALMGGVRIFVPLAEIKNAGFVGGRSFMPPAFGQLPDNDLADLVAYIATLKNDNALPSN